MNIRYKAPVLPGWEPSFGAPEPDDMARLLDRSRVRMSELEQTIEAATHALAAAQREYAITHRKVVVMAALLEEIDAMRAAPAPVADALRKDAGAREHEAKAGTPSNAERPERHAAETARRAGRWQWGLVAAGVSLLVAGITESLAPGTWAQAASVTTAATHRIR